MIRNTLCGVLVLLVACSHDDKSGNGDGAVVDLRKPIDLVGADLAGADLAMAPDDLQVGGGDLVGVDSALPPGSDLAGADLVSSAQPIVDTADSIDVATGAGRTDPEGVAPKSPSTQLVTWKDARHADRTMTLYGYLYQYDFSFVGGTAAAGQVTTRSAGDNAWGHPGFGFLVSHNTQTGNSPLGKANQPTLVETRTLVGGHHAFHHIELVYDRDKEGGGYGIKIPVVIEWMVATGRDHPVWSVTWKMGDVVNPQAKDFDVYRMDVRGPYGSLNFDGAPNKAAGDAVGGVAWGDFGDKFTTTSSPLTLQSTWTYNTGNTVNFSSAWTETTNAEMGIVETRPGDKTMGYQDRVYGRERGATSASSYTDKQDCTAEGDSRTYAMPCVNGWPYQLMEFDWDPSGSKPLTESTGTKLIAWGAPYGWLGASQFDNFDYSQKVDGTGDRAYAMFIVLGPKCRYSGASCSQPGEVASTLAAVKALAAATVSNVTTGAVATLAPKGPGAASQKTLANGYDDTYAVYTFDSAAGAVAFTFTPASGQPVVRPIFVVRDYPAATIPTITVGGAVRTVNTGDDTTGAYVSYDAAQKELWVTLNETVDAQKIIVITP